MSFTDLRIYNFIFNNMLPIKWLWFDQTLPFDMFVNINKCLYIFYILHAIYSIALYL